MKLLKSYLPALIIGGFAALTLFMSGSVIFDLFGIRAKEGNFVPFIVWTNFIAGWAYLAAAYGFATKKKWTTIVLVTFTVVLLIAFLSLMMHINAGGIYETKTVKAMTFRMILTAVMAVVAYFTITKESPKVL